MEAREAAEKALCEAGFKQSPRASHKWFWRDTSIEFCDDGWIEGNISIADLPALLHPAYSEKQVQRIVADTLHAIDDKANGWSKAAREAVHEGMGLFLRRLEEMHRD